jgi:hypothetical protein
MVGHHLIHARIGVMQDGGETWHHTEKLELYNLRAAKSIGGRVHGYL